MAEAEARSGAEVLLQALKEQGVEVIFGYPGGAVLPIYDALFRQNAIRHILVRHEQGAVHAAEGYARSTGRVGVVLVTSGPGATNAVTGLVDALMDSIPVVCLTGQVPTHLIGNDAFQEADTTGITRPATKHNYLVKRGEDLARVVHEAFYVARSGRPGPVVIDLPKDIVIGRAPYAPPDAGEHRSYRPRTEPDPARIAESIAILKRARRPVIYTGGGVINAGPRRRRSADRVRAPDGVSLHQHADGPRRLSGERSAVPRDARDARDVRGKSRHARCGRDAGAGRALRRSRDRAAGCVQPRQRKNPRRHRPVQHQQERGRRCRGRGRRGARAGGADRRLEGGRGGTRPPRARGMVAADRRLARDRLPALPPGPRARCGDQAAARGPATL